MLQKFFTNTIESKFIKSLLYNVNLPIMKTVSEGDFIVEGNTYIYKTSIIKCKRSGYIMLGNNADLMCSEFITVQDADVSSLRNLYVGDNPDSARYKGISPFVIGEQYVPVTQRYMSKYSYYDPDTHRYLGKYLRCVRDVFNINLMPFYNCFNYKIATDIKLTADGYSVGHDNSYKVIAVPIKFNKKYSVAIDCNSPVIMQSAFYGKFGLVKTSTYPEMKYLTEILNETPTYLSSMSFKHPHLYSISSNFYGNSDSLKKSRDCESFENLLYLLIRLPVSNNSSIVVIEGDYSDTAKVVVNAESIDRFTSTQVDNMFKSNLSLLQMSDNNIYAFSDRLIEYLLLNVIESNESIDNNIKYIRDYVFPYNKDNKGIWDFNLRNTLYNMYMSSSSTQKLDINGFVDKDMEKYITNNYKRSSTENKKWVREG